jgi:hypothetical protein
MQNEVEHSRNGIEHRATSGFGKTKHGCILNKGYSMLVTVVCALNWVILL